MADGEHESCEGRESAKVARTKSIESRTIGSPGQASHSGSSLGKEELLGVVAATRCAGRHDELPVALRLTVRDVPERHTACDMGNR